MAQIIGGMVGKFGAYEDSAEPSRHARVVERGAASEANTHGAGFPAFHEGISLARRLPAAQGVGEAAGKVHSP